MDEQCDDCGISYPGPPYYSFDPADCMNGDQPHGPECTGNMCPSCTGEFIIPDDMQDPRWHITTLGGAFLAAMAHNIDFSIDKEV
jgi:hypothetical protein